MLEMVETSVYYGLLKNYYIELVKKFIWVFP